MARPLISLCVSRYPLSYMEDAPIDMALRQAIGLARSAWPNTAGARGNAVPPLLEMHFLFHSLHRIGYSVWRFPRVAHTATCAASVVLPLPPFWAGMAKVLMNDLAFAD